MTDPGLNQRLRQRSRRSGLMIGFSMLLTLMVCVGAFTMIYARLEPVVADFVGRGGIELPTQVPTEEPVEEAPQPTAPPEDTTEEEPPPADENADADTEEVANGGDNQADGEDSDSDEFVPDYQVDANGPVNLRPGPGVASGDAIFAVPDATPLMYLGEEQATEDPGRDGMDNGQVWMRFRTEDGTEGWIREIDVSEYVP